MVAACSAALAIGTVGRPRSRAGQIDDHRRSEDEDHNGEQAGIEIGNEMKTKTQCQFSLLDCGTSSPIILDRLHTVFDDVRYKIRLYESPWTEEDFNEMEATSQRGIGVNVRPIRRIPLREGGE